MGRNTSDRRGYRTVAHAAVPSSLIGEAVADDLASRLRELAFLDKPGLLQAWEALIGTPPPPRCRAELLRMVLAYRIQARQFGGLSEATRRRLRRLAGGEIAAGDAPPSPRPLKHGTRLLREWQGRTHTVTITESGFAYDGKAYRSLSHIARTITGTRWSGPLFFGLRDKRRGDADTARYLP